MGTCVYSSSPNTQVAIRPHQPPCQRSHACEPHKYRLSKFHEDGVFLALIRTRRLQLFKRMIDQFDRLRKRNAFIDQYKKEKTFENGLEEFDDARYVALRQQMGRLVYILFSATAEELLKEYKACESPDYISYVRICLFVGMSSADMQSTTGFDGG